MKSPTTKNIQYKNNWNWGAVQMHMYPPPIMLFRSNNVGKLDKDGVKIKLRRDNRSEK